MCKWTKRKQNALYILKCTTRPRDFIVSVSLCIQLTACTHTVSQPAVQRDTKRPPSKPPLPLESHVFTPARSSLHCLPQPAFFPHPFFPPCSALNHMTPLGRSSPSPALKLNKGRLRRHTLGQSASCKHSLCVFMHLCVSLREAAADVVWEMRVVWPYSAVQRCSWPGVACSRPSSSHPWGPVSCGHRECAEPARHQRWWEWGPACWNSATCLTTRPAPGRHNRNKNRHIRYAKPPILRRKLFSKSANDYVVKLINIWKTPLWILGKWNDQFWLQLFNLLNRIICRVINMKINSKWSANKKKLHGQYFPLQTSVCEYLRTLINAICDPVFGTNDKC